MSVQVESPVFIDRNTPIKMSNDVLPHYPLHESVKDRLHKQYVEFYNTYLVNAQQSHLLPISVSRKTNVVFGGSALLPVGTTADLSIQRQETSGPAIRLRYFVPDGQPPDQGWPVTLYIHGGGWVLGNIDSENHICTNICARSRCVVITPEYRLAPEHPFPAALHDCWETLMWMAGAGSSILGLDVAKIAVSGCSAGANLAAAIVNKSLMHPTRVQIISQLLLVPVLDNTALPSNNISWKQNEFTAALPAAKMLWYRDHYLPNPRDRVLPEASPIFFLSPREPQSTPADVMISKIPRTAIIVGGVDILRQEGEDYAELLRQNNVRTTVHVMEGMPHPFLALDQILDEGKKAISLACDELTQVFA